MKFERVDWAFGLTPSANRDNLSGRQLLTIDKMVNRAIVGHAAMMARRFSRAAFWRRGAIRSVLHTGIEPAEDRL
jgi:hypothetical protein